MTPWNDYALATEGGKNDLAVICEGALECVISALRSLRLPTLVGIRVLLPDRGAAPYAFEADDLVALLDDPSRLQAKPAALPLRYR